MQFKFVILVSLFFWGCSLISFRRERHYENIILELKSLQTSTSTQSLKQRSLRDSLREHLPTLERSYVHDLTYNTVLAYWGESLNFDSGAKLQTVDSNILGLLQRDFSLSVNAQVTNSGLLHTYGYLLSHIDTPYGKKRDRYTSGQMSRGFGMKSEDLSDSPRSSGLLNNLTYFAAHLAFENLEQLDQMDENLHVADEIKLFDYSKVQRTTITEEVLNLAKPTKIKTVLIKFMDEASRDNLISLLIYLQEDTVSGEEKLLTVFPMSHQNVIDLLAESTMRSKLNQTPFRLRYNAYHPLINSLTSNDRVLMSKTSISYK